jgi:hypothetical protein
MIPQEIIGWSPYLILIYILIKDIIPKLFPELLKTLNKRLSTEDRLFLVLEKNTQALCELSTSISTLGQTLKDLDGRVSRIEDVLVDTVLSPRVKDLIEGGTDGSN